MGVLPLQFKPGENATTLGLTGREEYDVLGLAAGVGRRQTVRVQVRDENGERSIEAIARLDGPVEIEYFRQGGILPAVLRRLAGVTD
jgi:aconitate hydratase